MRTTKMASKACGCGDPQKAAVYLSGVIGRGTAKTGTQTEELSEFRCKRHNLNRAQYNRMLKRDGQDEYTEFYGPWAVIEFRSRPLEHAEGKTLINFGAL